MTRVTFLPLAHPRYPLDGPHPPANGRRRRAGAVQDVEHYARLWEEFLRALDEDEARLEDFA